MVVLGTLLLGLVLLDIRPVSVHAATSFTFTAAGDYGSLLTGTHGAQVLAKIRTLSPDFHLALGDLRYNTMSATTWCQTFKASFNNVVLIGGNHDDGDTDPGPMNTFDYACPSSVLGVPLISGPHQGNIDPSGKTAYGYDYAFEYPATNPIAKFIMVDPLLKYYCCGFPVPTSYAYSVGSAEYNWVSSQIDDAKSHGLWTIIGEHYNAFNNNGQQGYSTSQDLINLLYAKRVDLFLTGHEHNYQRTVQLKDCINKNITSCAIVNPAVAGPYTRGAGTVYSIIGTGGEDQFACCPVVNSPWAAGAYGSFGVVKFVVTDTSITGSFQAAIGSYTDSFSVANALAGNFAMSPSSPVVNQSVTFNGSASGGTAPYSFSWSFGDGGAGMGQTITHTYTMAQEFNVTLTITDTSNPFQTATKTRLVIVTSPPFDYSLSNSGGIIVRQGGSGTSTITATLNSGTSEPVTLSCVGSSLPAGASCLFNPDSLTPTGSSLLTVSSTPMTPIGSYIVQVTGSPTGGTTTPTAFTLIMQGPPPDFTISAASAVSFVSGWTGTSTITLTLLNGFHTSIDLAATVDPSTGLTVSFNPSSLYGNTPSTATFSSRTQGTYIVTIAGTSGSLIHTTNVVVTVAAPDTPDFTIATSVTSLTITADDPGTATITVVPKYGFDNIVDLTTTASPTGPAVMLSRTSISGSGSATVTTNIGSDTVAGTYTVTILGKSGNLSHKAQIMVVVNRATSQTQPPNTDSGNTNRMIPGLVLSTVFYPIMSAAVVVVIGLLVTTLVVVKMRKPKQ